MRINAFEFSYQRFLLAFAVAAGSAVAHPAEEAGILLDAPLNQDGQWEEPPDRPSSGGGFSGDVRWRARDVDPASSALSGAPAELRHRPYFYHRGRVRWGDRARIGWLAKRPSPGPALSAGEVRRLGVFKYALSVGDRLTAGHYALSYGQGLIFYDGLGEFVRPPKARAAGPSPDFSSGAGDYFRGAVLSGSAGGFSAAAFQSRKPLDADLDPSGGVVDEDLLALRDAAGDVQDEAALRRNDSVTETLRGGRLSFRFADGTALGVTAARSAYSRRFDPADGAYSYAHAFRGDGLALAGADIDARTGDVDVFGEAAFSKTRGAARRRGAAWTAGALYRPRSLGVWAGVFDYDADFYSPHGKGPALSVDDLPAALTHNQRGLFLGAEYRGRRYSARVNAAVASFPASLGDGRNADPLQPSRGRELYLENVFSPWEALSLSLRFQDRERDRRLTPPGAVEPRQGTETVRRVRCQVSWEPSRRARYRLRYETRAEEADFAGRGSRGSLLMGEVRFKPLRRTSLLARTYAFDSPSAYLTTGSEEIWDGVYYPRLAGGFNNLRGSPGSRRVFIFKQKAGEEWDLWVKHDVNRRPDDAPAARRAWHVQIDWTWN